LAILAQDPRRVGTLFLGSSVLATVLSLILTTVLRTGDQSGPDWHQLVTAHGLLMMVFTLMPALCGGLGLWLLPSQIGSRTLAFPRMAVLAWLIHAASLCLAALALITGSSDAGLAALFLAGTSAILVAINTVTTFLNMRAPGVTLGSAPLFAWSLAITGGLILMTVPAIAGASVIVAFNDTADIGQTIGFFAHPLIFILVMPAFGILSEIVATFSRRGLAGRTVVLASMGVLAGLGITLWLQELFSHGYAADGDVFMGLATTAAIPPALVIVTAWSMSLAQGVRQWSTPLIWTIGFIVLMVGAGAFSLDSDGMARFHYTLGLGSVFGTFAGLYFWFPKVARRQLPETMGRLHAVLMFIGVQLSFLPPIFGWPESVETAGVILSVFSFVLFLGTAAWALRFGKVQDVPWGDLPGLEWQNDGGAIPA